MPELNVCVEIPVTRRALDGALVAVLLFGLAGELASESVTLTTYYPAPSGAYGQMVATQNVIFARDLQSVSANPSYLAVGTSATPSVGTKLAVMGGKVGIGILAPTVPLQIVGFGTVNGFITRSSNIDFAVNGRIQLADPTNSAVIRLSGPTATTTQLMAGQVPPAQNKFGLSSIVGLYNSPNGNALGWKLTMTNAGNVGIGVDPINPAYPLNPIATFDVNGMVTVSGCSPAPAATAYVAGVVSCGGGNYATYSPGVIAPYMTGGDASLTYSGNMYCCPCPSGVCPL